MNIKFPKRLRYKRYNPIVDFYEKCMKIAFNLGIDGVDVTAFSVNIKDYKKLKKLLNEHIKINYPKLPYKKRQFEVGMTLLDIGPRIDNKIEEGMVFIHKENLYGRDT